MTPDQSQLQLLRPWIESETGMDFSGPRLQRLADAASKVIARLDDSTSVNLNKLLTVSDQRGLFLEQITAELTVGESYFFRNEYHIAALRDHVLPEILRENAHKREIRIWSAGCAGGEEPYSLAILVDQILGVHHGWHISILGTDLNPEFLARARTACFRPWSFRHTQIQEDRQYFQRDRDQFRLIPRVRDTVRFSYANLVKDVYPSSLTGTLGLDLILFRNVAIYLKPEVTQRIIERFCQALRPGGWLLLGETEVSLAPTEGFVARRFHHATFHQTADTPKLNSEPLSRPVLADFLTAATFVAGTVPVNGQQSAGIPVLPRLPDWVPLPCVTKAVPKAIESTTQRLERLLCERKFDDAERTIDRLADQRQRAYWRFRLAQNLLATAEAVRARQVLDRSLADDPMLIEAQLLLGSFAEESGDLETAESAYRSALYIDRNCPMAHFHLALVQQQKGDVAATTRSLRTILKLIAGKDPHQLVDYGEGVCYGRLKEMAEMTIAF